MKLCTCMHVYEWVRWKEGRTSRLKRAFSALSACVAMMRRASPAAHTHTQWDTDE